MNKREITEDNQHLKTYWNGEETPALRCVVVVKVATSSDGMPVFAPVQAVEVRYGDQIFYLDNSEPVSEGRSQFGGGWYKVTQGFGSPQWGHKSLEPVAVIFYYRSSVYEQEWAWQDIGTA